MRVLVTGGAGFVASHVVDALLARGDRVLVVDDLSTGDMANLAHDADLRRADISDEAALRGALGGEPLDAVVHAAAKTKVNESVEKPELYRRVIVDGTRNVLAAAERAGARAFVNFSSGGVAYGETPVCASEDMPARPISPYGVHKVEAEALVAAAPLRAVTLRPANIYGPRQRQDLEGGVVAIFQGCWAERRPISVRGGGTMERDYVYVGDVAEAVLAALASDRRGLYNVGTGVATSVNALVEALSAVLGPPAEITQAPAGPSELRRNCLDPSKAARELGWRPRTPLTEGLRRTIAA